MLEVHNTLGQEVTTLVSGRLNAGEHTIFWEAENVPSGVYLYRLEVGGYSETKKLMLLK